MQLAAYQCLKKLLDEIIVILSKKLLILDYNSLFLKAIAKDSDIFLTNLAINAEIVLLEHSIKPYLSEIDLQSLTNSVEDIIREPNINKTISLSLGKRPIEFIFTAFPIDEHENFCCMLLSQGFRQELSDMHFEFVDLLDNLPGNVYWKDKQSRYLGCNKSVWDMAGLKSRADIIGKTDFELCWSEFAHDWVAADNKVLRTGKQVIKEEKIRLSNGTVLTELTHKSPLKNQHGEIIGTIGASLDITEFNETKRKLEQALREAKVAQERENILQRYRQFVDDQEHDIRTPLGGLASGTDALEYFIKTDTNEALEFLAMMKKSAWEILDYQESLLYDLYQGSRPGRSIFVRFDLKDIVHRIYQTYLTAVKLKGLDYTYEYEPTIPLYLLGNGKWVYQCLLDLMSNAVRFTSQGSIQLKVECIHLLEKEAVVRFKVTDTGCGIPKERCQDIYDAFVKLSPSNRGGEHGRGLGLTRVHTYAQQMGGELRFDSEEGKGSCFKLVLPFTISLDQTAES